MTTTLVSVGMLALVGFWTYRTWRNAALWRARAEKLGRTYGIATRDDITARVANHLRWQYLARTPFVLILFGGLQTVAYYSGDDPLSPSGACLMLALLAVTLTAQLAIVRRRPWNRARSAERIAHLTRATLTQTFALPEMMILAAGSAFAALGGGWQLTHDGQPVLAGVWLMLLVGIAVLGRRAIDLLLSRASSAHDDLELGWDDVLRHIDVRELAEGIVVLPAFVAALLLCRPLMAGGNLLPLYAIVIVFVAWAFVFRRGRLRWKQLWDGAAPG